jgi:trk system potassium uptake protein
MLVGPMSPALALRTIRRVLLGMPGLVVASAVVTAVDFSIGVEGALSVALTLLSLGLALAWGKILLSDPRGNNQLRAWLVKGVLIVLMGVSLVAKGLALSLAASAPAEYVASYRTYGVAVLLVFVAGLGGRGDRFGRFLAVSAEHPARLALLSFGTAGLLGGFLLALPPSLQHVQDASLLDAMFMSFSAVCVTGLAVHNVAETYTVFGQMVLCGLIQIGGLGIMVLSAALGVFAGKRMQVKSGAVLAEMIDADSVASLRRIVVSIVLTTFVLEAAGAALFWVTLRGHAGLAEGDLLWASVFHSVSAFCNAGFTLFPDGLAQVSGSVAVLGVAGVMIVLGGIGFPVFDEMRSQLWARLRRRRPRRVSLHARVALSTTALVTAVAAFALFAFETQHSMKDLGFFSRLLASVFHAVSMRTAGFDTVDLGALSMPAMLVTCIAMAIGASPGSTGGGLKTTTAATIFAAIRAELRRHPAPRLFDRAIPGALVRRALGLFFLGLSWFLFTLLLLFTIEDHPPAKLVFETVSALSTTGLSMGITADLTSGGKLVILVTMLLGRVGPLTAAMALADRRGSAPPYALPEERVLVG